MIKSTKQAFSLIEVMIIFTVMAAIMAAALPMITRKHSPIPEVPRHGMYTCVPNENGNGFTQIIRDRMGREVQSGNVNQCTFAPNTRVSSFSVDIYSAGAGGTRYGRVKASKGDLIERTYSLRDLPGIINAGGSVGGDNGYRRADETDGWVPNIDTETLMNAFNGTSFVRSIKAGDAGKGGDAYFRYRSPSETVCTAALGGRALVLQKLGASVGALWYAPETNAQQTEHDQAFVNSLLNGNDNEELHSGYVALANKIEFLIDKLEHYNYGINSVNFEYVTNNQGSSNSYTLNSYADAADRLSEILNATYSVTLEDESTITGQNFLVSSDIKNALNIIKAYTALASGDMDSDIYNNTLVIATNKIKGYTELLTRANPLRYNSESSTLDESEITASYDILPYVSMLNKLYDGGNIRAAAMRPSGDAAFEMGRFKSPQGYPNYTSHPNYIFPMPGTTNYDDGDKLIHAQLNSYCYEMFPEYYSHPNEYEGALNYIKNGQLKIGRDDSNNQPIRGSSDLALTSYPAELENFTISVPTDADENIFGNRKLFGDDIEHPDFFSEQTNFYINTHAHGAAGELDSVMRQIGSDGGRGGYLRLSVTLDSRDYPNSKYASHWEVHGCQKYATVAGHEDDVLRMFANFFNNEGLHRDNVCNSSDFTEHEGFVPCKFTTSNSNCSDDVFVQESYVIADGNDGADSNNREAFPVVGDEDENKNDVERYGQNYYIYRGGVGTSPSFIPKFRAHKLGVGEGNQYIIEAMSDYDVAKGGYGGLVGYVESAIPSLGDCTTLMAGEYPSIGTDPSMHRCIKEYDTYGAKNSEAYPHLPINYAWISNNGVQQSNNVYMLIRDEKSHMMNDDLMNNISNNGNNKTITEKMNQKVQDSRGEVAGRPIKNSSLYQSIVNFNVDDPVALISENTSSYPRIRLQAAANPLFSEPRLEYSGQFWEKEYSVGQAGGPGQHRHFNLPSLGDRCTFQIPRGGDILDLTTTLTGVVNGQNKTLYKEGDDLANMNVKDLKAWLNHGADNNGNLGMQSGLSARITCLRNPNSENPPVVIDETIPGGEYSIAPTSWKELFNGLSGGGQNITVSADNPLRLNVNPSARFVAWIREIFTNLFGVGGNNAGNNGQRAIAQGGFGTTLTDSCTDSFGHVTSNVFDYKGITINDLKKGDAVADKAQARDIGDGACYNGVDWDDDTTEQTVVPAGNDNDPITLTAGRGGDGAIIITW